MTCSIIPEVDYKGFDESIYRKLLEKRVPVGGSFELTFRCNMNCLHCYASNERRGNSSRPELSLHEVLRLIDELASGGVLFLLLTGGEPLLRKDFLDIYTYMKKRGILVTLFTNGTLITPEIANVLEELPPLGVEITLYGANETTYENITQVAGSYKKCMDGIYLLLGRGVKLGLKTVVMKPNQHELEQMKELAETLGVDFRYDALVVPCLDGDMKPCAFRLPPEEAVKLDIEDNSRRTFWKSVSTMVSADSEYLYTCGAGLNTFHIDPYGGLSACLMVRLPRYELLTGSFHDGWYDFLYHNIRERKLKSGYKCANCTLVSICDQCPGWAQMENGNEESPIAYVCKLAHLRAERLCVNMQNG